MTAGMQATGVNEKNLSEVQEFYRNKSVFLTGGSGFLGKGTNDRFFCKYVDEVWWQANV